MKDYMIITDATCDMNQDILDRYEIGVIPMEVAMDDGRTFMHYPDFRNFAPADFYKELARGNLAHTTQITPNQYKEFLTPLLKEGKDILYVCFSSGLSNTYASSVMAFDELREQFPERRLITVDSLCASGGEGAFAVQAALNRENGMEMEENAQWLLDNRLRMMHFFTVGDLMYLHKGGRVSAASAIAGTALAIKPMMYVDNEGKLVVGSKVHGRRTSLKKLVANLKASVEHPEDQVIYVCSTDAWKDAESVADWVRQEVPCKDVVMTTVGPVVGTHTGPSLVCVFAFGSNRIAKE